MSGRLNGRHRRQHNSADLHAGLDGAADAAPPQRCGPASRVSVFAGGVAVAGATVLGGVLMGPLHPADLLSPVQQRDVALVVDTTATTDPFSLTGLLNDILINGQPLGGLSLVDLVNDSPALSAITVGQLLGDIGLTNGLDTTVPELLDFIKVGDTTVNSLLSAAIPGVTGTTTIGGLLTALPGLGGAANLGDVTVDQLLSEVSVPSGDEPLSDTTTLSQLLTDFPSLGNLTLPAINILGLNLTTGTLSSLVNDLGLGNDSLGTLLNFTSTTDLSELATEFNISSISIDSLLGDLGTENGVTLSGTSDIDDLATFFGFGSTELGSFIPGDLTNASGLADLLGDTSLLGNIGTEPIDTLLAGM